MSTWGEHRPLFHFSNGKKDPSDRAHSEYVYELHHELFEFDLDIDFEFKAKDLAVKDFENKKDLLLEKKGV
jgi:UV DNA damage repair endonuclease